MFPLLHWNRTIRVAGSFPSNVMTALEPFGHISHPRSFDFGKKLEMSGLLPPKTLPQLFPNMYRHGNNEGEKFQQLHSLVFRHQFQCQPTLADLHRGLVHGVDIRGHPHPDPPRVPPVVPTFNIKDILASEPTPVHKPIPRHPSSCATCQCIGQQKGNENETRPAECSPISRESPNEPGNNADSLKFGIHNILSKSDDLKNKGKRLV